MSEIITVTVNPAIDTSFSVDHVIPEKKLRGHSIKREAGGGGINVARAIVKLGGQAGALVLAGGPTGQMLETLVRRELSDCRMLPTRDWTRENLIVWEESTGQQFRFTMPGPQLEESEWQQVFALLEQLAPRPKYLVASGSLSPGIPDDFYARLAELAARMGCRYILDTSGRPLQLAMRAGGIFLAKPNQGELEELARAEGGDGGDATGMARRLVEEGRCEVIMLSLGRAGARMITRDKVVPIHPPPVPLQSRVGAGDSMVGGILHALGRGWSLEEAAFYGVAAGTAATMTPGTELCRREDTERLYRQMQGVA